MAMRAGSDWKTRGYLPHYDPPGACQHIIFRLDDALPAKVIEEIRIASLSDRFARAERALDAGHGSRALARPDIARLVATSLAHFDGERYRLLAWCVMPNHTHLLIERFPSWPIPDLVRTWKSFHRAASQRASWPRRTVLGPGVLR